MEITRNLEILATAKQHVYDRLADARFRPKIAKTFPFVQTVDAHKYLEPNAQVGKIVITIP
jgi:NADPH:quinone reductase-like Zn-dependent oxidoreductase